MDDYISREAEEQFICEACERPGCPRLWGNDCEIIYRLNTIPAADVVARDCYDRVLAENDTMRKQLAQIGKKAGDKMDDVRPVVKGHWERSLWFVTCSVCEYTSADTDDEGSEIALNFCPNCGAEMEPNLDATKGDSHD